MQTSRAKLASAPAPVLDRGVASHVEDALRWFGRLLAGCALIAFLGVAPVPALEPQVSDGRFQALREQMVEHQIEHRGVRDARVLAAMKRIPRHLFVPEALRPEAYVDHPLPIGGGQTISQPYIVGLMTSLLELDGSEKVLEIGTGSGYQAAVLGELALEVYTIEIREPLGLQAEALLESLGYRNVHVRIGNGYRGWPEEAPFDAIIVTASPPDIPKELVEQLKLGGRMVVPVGGGAVQDLELLTKSASGLMRKDIVPVRFVPMVGDQQ